MFQLNYYCTYGRYFFFFVFDFNAKSGSLRSGVLSLVHQKYPRQIDHSARLRIDRHRPIWSEHEVDKFIELSGLSLQ